MPPKTEAEPKEKHAPKFTQGYARDHHTQGANWDITGKLKSVTQAKRKTDIKTQRKEALEIKFQL